MFYFQLEQMSEEAKIWYKIQRTMIILASWNSPQSNNEKVAHEMH